MLTSSLSKGVSIVGWGYDEERDKQHWIIRNSWGVYWVCCNYCLHLGMFLHLFHPHFHFALYVQGEMGFFRIELGRNLLGVEDNFAWANPAQWTAPYYECRNTYVDPSVDVPAILRR